MADDDLLDTDDEAEGEDFEEEEFDAEEFDEEEFDADLVEADDDLVEDVDEVVDEEEEEEDEPGPRPVARKTSDDDEEDDEDVLDPDDIEADLEEILRDRIAAADDDEDEEEEEESPLPSERAGGSVAPKRADEWTCPGCFLIVSASQFGPRSNPTCPSGEDPCPSIAML